MHPIQEIVRQQKMGCKCGIYSCCSANEYVLRTVMERARSHHIPALIESTANQVDQFGGYTGMRPVDFYNYCYNLAHDTGLDSEMLILGGDHLGPLTWSAYPEKDAMANAVELVRQYVLAGFTKIHIDTSMRVASDDPGKRLKDEVIAARGAWLCAVAEAAFNERKASFPNAQYPVYIIGSEVPIPGGAQHQEESIAVTKPGDASATLCAFQRAFEKEGLAAAWKHVVAVVIQPGVEFGDREVFEYDRGHAAALTALLEQYPSLVFEGHSTDYQPKEKLKEMVEDGIAILKVGPALTFAFREALCALEKIEIAVFEGKNIWLSNFKETLETAMLENPSYWQKHYHGDGVNQRISRLYSFSDRARYYLPLPAVKASIDRLIGNFNDFAIPFPLLSQFMPAQYKKIRSGQLRNSAAELVKDRIGECIDDYLFACSSPVQDPSISLIGG